MVGSGGVSRFGFDITIEEFNVSTKILSESLKEAIVSPSLNEMS